MTADFKRLWAGQTVSLLGSAVTLFALPTLAVLGLHASPVQLGALTAFETLPFPVLGMLAGVLADRYPRRRMMICADLVRFIALAAIPLLALLHLLAMPQLYAVAVVTGSASAFFGIAYQSYLPVLVPPEQLTGANAKLEFSNSGSAMAGNALGGALVQWLGAPLAIAADAASYLVSVISLLGITTPEPVYERSPLTLSQAKREALEGLHVVFSSSDLRWILYATATSNFGSGIISAVFFIYAYRVLHLQPGLLGVVNGFAEVGFIGALLAARVRSRLGLRSTLIFSLLITGVAFIGILTASLGAPYVVVFVQGAIVAVFIPIYNINQVSYRQALVDVRLQGRMNATMRTFVWGTLPLGAALGGWCGSLVGVPATIALGGIVACAAALWVLPLRERTVHA